MKFYWCSRCGNVFLVIEDGGVNPDCCGQPMEVLEASTVDGAAEKHVPVIERDGNKITVKVGVDPHPMLPEHNIAFVAIHYGDRYQIERLKISGEQKTEFAVNSDDDITAYGYCNVHGLWKS